MVILTNLQKQLHVCHVQSMRQKGTVFTDPKGSPCCCVPIAYICFLPRIVSQ